MGASDQQAGKIMGLDLERLAKVFINLREARSALARKFNEEDEELKKKQGLVQAVVLDFLNKTKQKSASTALGTFYKQLDIKPTGSDWEAFYAWVKENDAFDFLERRIKKSEVADYMERHDGEAPPGVSVLREFVVRVRANNS
jgi:hypothetical protein